MALGKKEKKNSALNSKTNGGAVNGDEIELGLGFVKYKRGLGRKRVLMLSEIEKSMEEISSKRNCGEIMVPGSEAFGLEFLPRDVLIRIILGVHHEDLKQLLHVSKTIEDATLIAKELHFAFSTPKKTRVFRNSIDLEESIDFDEDEAPNAPKRTRHRRLPMNRKNVSTLSASLFA